MVTETTAGGQREFLTSRRIFFFCLKGCFLCVHVDLFVVVAVVVFSSLPEQAFILYIFLLINFLRNEHRPPLPPSTFFEGPEKV